MTNPMDTCWQLKLECCQHALQKNNFEVFVVSDIKAAGEVFRDRILPEIDVKVVSWGDSMTLSASGVLEMLRPRPAYR